MLSLKFRIISIASAFLFVHLSFHTFEHYTEHFSGTHDEVECAYFDVTKFAPTDYEDNKFNYFPTEISIYTSSNNKFFDLKRLYDPRGSPRV